MITETKVKYQRKMMFRLLLSMSLFVALPILVYASSTYVLGTDSLIYDSNALLTDSKSKIEMMFPLLLLAVALIFAFIDFAAIGVIIGCITTLVFGFMIGLLPVDLMTIINLGVLAMLLIWKMWQ
jgi:hypothetical protein